MAYMTGMHGMRLQLDAGVPGDVVIPGCPRSPRAFRCGALLQSRDVHQRPPGVLLHAGDTGPFSGRHTADDRQGQCVHNAEKARGVAEILVRTVIRL